MKKICSLEELGKLKTELIAKTHGVVHSGKQSDKIIVRVAMATCGIASGAKKILDYMKEEMLKRNIDGEVIQTGCMTYCYAEPTIEVTLPEQDPVVFGWVDQKKADLIIERYIKSGEFVEGIIPVNYSKIENVRREER